MHFFFGSTVWKWIGLRRRGPKAGPQAKTVPSNKDPRAYTITVRRDEVAVSRFIKRLSASGAEHIQVAYPQADVACVRMQRPSTAADWDATVARLLDRCGLRRMASDAACKRR